MNIRVLTVADLHQRESLYEQLAEAVAEHKPHLVACVGDFLDAEMMRMDAARLSPGEAAARLSALPAEVVFTRGNHEADNWMEFEEQWKKSGRQLHALHGSAAAFGPLVVVGFPCFMGDAEFYARGRELPDYSPADWLWDILRKFGPAARSLFLMHEPPSPALAQPFFHEERWRDAVEEFHPLVTVSGHDHLTPLETGRWHAAVGGSVCINVGQRVHPQPGRLLYCLLDFEFPRDTPCLASKFTFRKCG